MHLNHFGHLQTSGDLQNWGCSKAVIGDAIISSGIYTYVICKVQIRTIRGFCRAKLGFYVVCSFAQISTDSAVEPGIVLITISS